MNQATSLKQSDHFKLRRLTPVIHLLPVVVKRKGQKVPGKAKMNKASQFHTDPIFKARDHDFL